MSAAAETAVLDERLSVTATRQVQAEPASSQTASAGRRVAAGSIARSLGELIAKGASVVFYLVAARRLGTSVFGDFMFGLSLSSVVLTFAGLGSEELLARQISRDRQEVHRLYHSITSLKALMLCLLSELILLIVVLDGYRGETLLALMLISGGIALERTARNYHAVFQGYERQDFLAISLIAARFTNSAVGVVALLMGADLLLVSVIFMVGSGMGNLSGFLMMRRYLVVPRRQVDVGRWREILKVSIPLGLVSVLYLLLMRLDSTMLAFIGGGAGDNSELGQYGAAQRLIESTMFVSWAIGGAMLPWFSRHSGDTEVTLARGYEVALKAQCAVLMPIATGYVVLATPLIDLLYGDAYANAANSLRLLGLMTVLFGINTMVSVLMISREKPGRFTRPAAAVIAQNVIFNFILIPPYGATGAAFNALLSGVLLAIWMNRTVKRTIGPVNPMRIYSPPILASVFLAATLIGLGGLTIPALAAGALVYPLAFLAIERYLYPGDFIFYWRLVRRAD